MELTSLGFDSWFEERVAGLLPPGRCLARVTAVDRDAFLIRDPDGERYAELSGKFRFTARSAGDLPCVGDWVCAQRPESDGPAIIHEVWPRKTLLRRKRPGKVVDFQMIAANIDTAFIVQGCDFDFNVPRLERYLVMARDGRMGAHIIMSKTDLVSPEELERRIEDIRRSGISAPIARLSNATGAGMEAFRAALAPGKTYCLLGSSGVGKTTLINRLLGKEAFETRAVSGTGEGVHTTSRRQLLVLDNGAMLIDTPGMRELGLLGAEDGIDATFHDIADYSTRCRFPDCTHTSEPGCAVLAALQDGELSEERYQGYLKLKKEAEYHNLSYVEKRKKDKTFGRFFKSAMKQMKRSSVKW
ncbi:MAG TPA: ribosome small subunit-dependent GTPase A [Kiritimatiellia bacterium]|nr:ribosome small subunit-dependent GTPase A [Kiritimatiellia bacterium]